MTIFFSIILPTYNRAQLIERAIESVLAQTFADWELIVIDDGSTDNTQEVVEGYTDPRIRYHWQPNAERSAARNKGIALAQGQYIGFLDSDDYYFNDHLQRFYDHILANDSAKGLYFCNAVEDNMGEITKIRHPDQGERKAIEYLLLYPIATPRACIHRDILQHHQFDPKIRIGEDTELWVRIAAHYPLIATNEYTQVFVEHEGRSVSRKNVGSYLQALSLKKRLVNQYCSQLSPQAYRQILHNVYFSLGQAYYENGQKLNMVRAFLSTFRYGQHRWKEMVYLMIK